MIKHFFTLPIRIISGGIIKQTPIFKKLTISMLVFLFVFSSFGYALAAEVNNESSVSAPQESESTEVGNEDAKNTDAISDNQNTELPPPSEGESSRSTLTEEDDSQYRDSRKPIENKLHIDKDNTTGAMISLPIIMYREINLYIIFPSPNCT
jgi:hypothetical protein